MSADSRAMSSVSRRFVLAVGVALAVGAGTVGLTACGSDSGGGSTSASSSGSTADNSPLGKLKAKGSVRMAVVDAPPSSFPTKGDAKGLIPELATMVLKKMGIAKVEAVPMDFGAQIPSLQSGRIDVAAGGFYVTADRCKAITFAEPSFYYLDGFAVEKGNPDHIRTYKDIAKAGVNMGSVAGAANVELAEADGVPKSKIQEYPDIPSMFDALKAGRIQAAPYDNVSIAYFVSRPAYSGSLQASDPTAPIVNGKPQPYSVSIGFPKDAGNLATEFNKLQAQMFADGEFDALMKKWALPKESIRPSDAPDIKDVCAQK